jgi:hypothetical protein
MGTTGRSLWNQSLARELVLKTRAPPPPRSARKMKNLHDLREGLDVPKMLPSLPDVAARGPARRGPRKFL